MGRELFVRMTTEERSEHAKTIASHRNRQIALEVEKDEKAKHFNSLIKAEQAEIDRIVRLITDDGENRDQMSLTFEEQQQATEALAQLYRRAECTPVDSVSCPIHGVCSCDMETPGVHKTDCALHGVDAPHAKDAPMAAPDPLPTEEQEIAALAEECLADWKARGIVPESVNHRNHLVGEFFAVKQVASRRRKRVREAINAALADQPLPPAGAGAEPSEEGAEASA